MRPAIKIILVLVVIIFFSGFHLAKASIVINEIMYDLPGSDTVNNKNREWVEMYNPDAIAVEVTSYWRFNDGSSHWMNGKNTFSIPAGGYVVLVSDKNTFLSDHVGFSGTVIDTVMSLNNTSKTLKILDASGVVINSVTYSSSQGANGDSNSLQLINGSWISATPTPGIENKVSHKIIVKVVPAEVFISKVEAIQPLIKILPEPDLVSELTPVKIIKVEAKKNPAKVQILPKDLSAAIINSEIPPINSNYSYLLTGGFIVLLGASAGAVYFVRRRKVPLEAGSDFDILDE